MENYKYYIVTQDYKETSEEIALAPGLDHNSVFITGIGIWEEARATCAKHNALFFQPRDENFEYVHKKYGQIALHAGMYLKDDKWKTCKGTEVEYFFWDTDKPANFVDRTCGRINSRSKLSNVKCNYAPVKGLCIY